jgi:hypothetical protein
MKSVAKLRRIGFTVAATNSDQAVGCTEVRWTSPFYYFNPRFAATPRDIFEKLQAAPEVSPGEFQLVIAGEHFGDDDELPFTIILSPSQKTLERYYNPCNEIAAEIARLNQEHADRVADFEAVTKSIIEG